MRPKMKEKKHAGIEIRKIGFPNCRELCAARVILCSPGIFEDQGSQFSQDRAVDPDVDVLIDGTDSRRAAKLYRARSRLYQSQILRVNTKYSFESYRRDLHNTLLCTALESNLLEQLP